MNALFEHSILLADWWTTMMSDLDPNKRFALITVVFGCATGVICTIVVFVSGTINSIHRRRMEADMSER